MDISKYFKVVSLSGNVLHVETRGFITAAVVDWGGQAYLAQFKEAIDTVSSRGPFLILADITELAVLSAEASALLTEALIYAKSRGLYKVVEIVPSALTEMSVKNAATAAGNGNLRVAAGSLEEAQHMIEKLLGELPST